MAKKPFLLVSLLLLTLTACAAPAHQPLADADYAEKVKTVSASHKKARIFAMEGYWKGGLFKPTNKSPADFYINGSNVGGINKNQCLVIEVRPGKYSFEMAERTKSSTGLRTPPKTYNLSSGESLYVAFSINKTTGVGVFFGALGGLADAVANPPTAELDDVTDKGKEMVKDLQIVLPDSEVASDLRPMEK